MKVAIMATTVWLSLFTALPVFAGSAYSINANQAVQWLSHNQNSDGSWGATEDVKLPYTMEAVTALQAFNQRIPAYYWGITWLENHNAPNIDYKARRILALAQHGDNVQADLSYLQTSQMLIQPGNNGWGLSPAYQGAALDSALAILACSQLSVTTNVQKALDYLKMTQLAETDKGWAVAQETTSDPVTTALVVQALTGFMWLDATLATPIANGVAALNAKVNSTSPPYVQAIAALANQRAGYAANATALLNTLSTLQATDGSWSQDTYTTALVLRAMAASMGNDLSVLSDIVYIPDPNLRAAINKAMGRNSMDTLTKGDMANLTTIYAADLGIKDLTGLEWAINLISADLRNNYITSTAPLTSLANLTDLQLSGNPAYTAGVVRIVNGSYYSSLQEAFIHAVSGSTIQAKAAELNEGINLDNAIHVSIAGGYDTNFSNIIGTTLFSGQLSISNGGSMTINNITIQLR